MIILILKNFIIIIANKVIKANINPIIIIIA